MNASGLFGVVGGHKCWSQFMDERKLGEWIANVIVAGLILFAGLTFAWHMLS